MWGTRVWLFWASHPHFGSALAPAFVWPWDVHPDPRDVLKSITCWNGPVMLIASGSFEAASERHSLDRTQTQQGHSFRKATQQGCSCRHGIFWTRDALVFLTHPNAAPVRPCISVGTHSQNGRWIKFPKEMMFAKGSPV